MKKRIPNFADFVMNEGLQIKESKLIRGFDKLKDWASDLYNSIKSKVFKIIPRGLKRGVSVVGYFDPSRGSVFDQVNDFYKGTDFAKSNNLLDLGNKFKEQNMSEGAIPLEYTGADKTVRNINAPELKQMVEKLYRAKVRGGRAKPIFIYGAPGIGKTQIVAQAADTLGIPLLALDLQFMAPEDFLGIPEVITSRKPKYDEDGKLVDVGSGVTRSNPPTILPRDNGKNDKGGIIFMDEMNRASKIVLDSVMQFVQMGRLGEYNLPSKWIIVAAGNRPEEATVAEFDFALADRFRIVNFVPIVEDWARWARTTKTVPPVVIGFIEKNQELFHLLDPEKGTLKFPTPRSWTDAAAALMDELADEGKTSWRDLPIERIYNIFADELGPEAAAQFKEYLNVISEFSEKDIQDMVENPERAKGIDMKKTNATSIVYGITEMAIAKAIEINQGEEPPMKHLYHILLYLSENVGKEQLSWAYKQLGDRFEKVKFDPAKASSAEKVGRLASGNKTEEDEYLWKMVLLMKDKLGGLGAK